MFQRSTFIRCALAAAACLALVPAQAADVYPSKEIRFVVPWNAGGSNDIAARALA